MDNQAIESEVGMGIGNLKLAGVVGILTALMMTAPSLAAAGECRKGAGTFSSNIKVCGCPRIGQSGTKKKRWTVMATQYQCDAEKSAWIEAGNCVDIEFKSLDSAIEVIRALAADNSQTCY